MLENGILQEAEGLIVGEAAQQFLELEDEIDVFPRFNVRIPRERRGVERKCLIYVAHDSIMNEVWDCFPFSTSLQNGKP